MAEEDEESDQTFDDLVRLSLVKNGVSELETIINNEEQTWSEVKDESKQRVEERKIYQSSIPMGANTSKQNFLLSEAVEKFKRNSVS